MKISPLRLAVVAGLMMGGFSIANPAFAAVDQIAELKAELARQKEIAAQQAARLEALESKLNAALQDQQSKLNAALDVQRSVAEADAKEKKAAAKIGDGLTVTYNGGKDEVKLYGLLDLTIRNRSNNNTAGGDLTDITTGYLSGSRWGIIGKHNLGWDNGSAAAIYKLESEYELRTGAEDTAGVLFNRDAWVGLESDTLGRVTFGRQNTLGRDFAEVYGVPFAKPGVDLTEGGWSNNNVAKQGIFYLAGSSGTRYDGGVVWKKKFGDFVGGAAYQFSSSDTSVAFQRNTSEAVAGAYNGENYTLVGEYNRSDINGLNHDTFTIGGNYRFGDFRVNAGWYHYTAEQAKVGDRTDNNYVLSGSYNPGAGPWVYYLSWEGAHAHNAGYNSKGYTLNPFKDTTGVKTAGSGDRDAYQAVAMYKLDKRTDLYVLSDYMKTSDGYHEAAANGYRSVLELAIGLRLRF